MGNPRRVVYVVSNELVQSSSQLPSNPNRSAIVHSLVKAYGLLDSTAHPNLRVTFPVPATHKDLCAYHDSDYVDALLSPSSNAESDSDFGLHDDCPRFPGLAKYAALSAGATLTAARALCAGTADVGIAWDGGRHHAQKARAAGFCYANDCVLAVLALRKLGGGRVLYIDLDLHFADAVAAAFPHRPGVDSSVLVLSLHHAARGFYPAVPPGCASTLPLLAGASASTFLRVWTEGIEAVYAAFRPDAVVVQCGADGLAGDPCGVWNWSLSADASSSSGSRSGAGSGSATATGMGMGDVVQRILDWRLPTLLLGGGGYNAPNTARAWAYLTSLALGAPLHPDAHVPDHAFYPLYKPSFTLDVPAGNKPDENLRGSYLDEVVDHLKALAESIAAARKT